MMIPFTAENARLIHNNSIITFYYKNGSAEMTLTGMIVTELSYGELSHVLLHNGEIQGYGYHILNERPELKDKYRRTYNVALRRQSGTYRIYAPFSIWDIDEGNCVFFSIHGEQSNNPIIQSINNFKEMLDEEIIL